MYIMSKAHNLNIHMYSLDEILELFQLSYDISMEDLKRAKKIVLMTHPDKSRLPSEYFLFYKKAFDVVIRFYENQTKQNQTITSENTTYRPTAQNTNKSTTQQVSNAIKEMSSREFQQKFNQLFEENMQQKPDPSRNEWFSKDAALHTIDEPVNSKNMGQMFDRIKEKQASVVKYRGVENLVLSGGTKLYENEDEDEDDMYVECDPFSKLKFDDLRKVHKDQTVFAVSERDYNNVPKYSSVDHFMRERGRQTLTPLEKQDAEQLLQHQEQMYRQKMMNKEYADSLRTSQYEEKNKAVLSNFLRLSNY